jgi:glutamyl-tRNA synthetase
MKDYKANPDQYQGNVGDIAMILRAALTGRTRTPDLYQMMQVLGKERVTARLIKVAEIASKE